LGKEKGKLSVKSSYQRKNWVGKEKGVKKRRNADNLDQSVGNVKKKKKRIKKRKDKGRGERRRSKASSPGKKVGQKSRGEEAGKKKLLRIKQ